MQIKEIKNEQEISAIYSIFKKNFENLNEKTFVKNTQKLLETQNYKIFTALENKDISAFLTLRILEKIDGKKIAQIDNFLIQDQKNFFTTGSKLIDFISQNIKSFDCQEIEISPLTKDLDTHKIFSQNKFILEGFYFKKTL